MRIFLISPSRNITDDEKRQLAEYESRQSVLGHSVYIPYRDTDQDDPTGLRICETHLNKMEQCDEIHIWWNPDSQFTLFDMGMAWALRKPMRLANAVRGTDGKSAETFLLAWEEDQKHISFEALMKDWQKRGCPWDR